MVNDILLPIKVVIPSEQDVRRPESSGGKSKIFVPVTKTFRNQLEDQVEQVHEYFSSSFSAIPKVPGVARITLRSEAIAKSHRPLELLGKAKCPVIGVDNLGELLVGVSSRGLRNLASQINSLGTQNGIANLSTISTIEPYRGSDALGTLGFQGIVKRIRVETNSIKLRLFRHNDKEIDEQVYQAFLDLIQTIGLKHPKPVFYSSKMNLYRLNGVREEMIQELSNFIGTQSLTTFPTYRVHRLDLQALGRLSEEIFPPPSPNVDYPKVGLIDSGVDPNNSYLEPWILSREFYVDENNRNYEHGSFVAGLAINAQKLNQHPKFSNESSKLLDIVAMPNDGSLNEDELVVILQEVLAKHRDIKIWNLSLNDDAECNDFAFSNLAIALDELQDEYDVTFVISAGNYSTPPFRSWPPDDQEREDRVTSPADSIRGITVGSLAHLEHHNSIVCKEQPSPFSRRGPGPAFTPKPEVVHYGGNCDANGRYDQTGVISTGLGRSMVENVGTSFAVPMIATTLANLDKLLVSPASRNLQKALIIHSAACNSEPRKIEELRYYGFGVPGELVNILTCVPWSVTLILETELLPGLEFERTPFPIPSCLRNNKGLFVGEILMTAVYDPPLDPSFGAEYCRSNVNVSLGTYEFGDDGKRVHKKQVPMDPKNVSDMYETTQVEHGFKWSPVKVFRRKSTRGIKGDDWRLRITVNHRSNFRSTKPQKFALIVTIRDPSREKPVYDETVALMRQYAWVTEDLRIHEQIQTRT